MPDTSLQRRLLILPRRGFANFLRKVKDADRFPLRAARWCRMFFSPGIGQGSPIFLWGYNMNAKYRFRRPLLCAGARSTSRAAATFLAVALIAVAAPQARAQVLQRATAEQAG